MPDSDDGIADEEGVAMVEESERPSALEKNTDPDGIYPLSSSFCPL